MKHTSQLVIHEGDARTKAEFAALFQADLEKRFPRRSNFTVSNVQSHDADEHSDRKHRFLVFTIEDGE